jgi:hypothetical protein
MKKKIFPWVRTTILAVWMSLGVSAYSYSPSLKCLHPQAVVGVGLGCCWYCTDPALPTSLIGERTRYPVQYEMGKVLGIWN